MTRHESKLFLPHEVERNNINKDNVKSGWLRKVGEMVSRNDKPDKNSCCLCENQHASLSSKN